MSIFPRISSFSKREKKRENANQSFIIYLYLPIQNLLPMGIGSYFGFASLFNFGSVGKTGSVEQAEFRANDRKKAWQIIIYSVIVGIIVAIVAYYFPLNINQL